ncbi:terminase small subunit [Flavobacterium selenitireducens]|uniref:terminase small subunit n=1 Tax=Flavobacterium selenitireducens TaxID=2722704 RepID=UPI00168ABC0E|nr:terminase small subunit [Flavobacterium selenitireducens]MBD3582757.1 hypothetical protein [Flavobacterium selenitireducens]
MARPRKIKTPAKMWEHFEAYRKELRDNPILIVEQKRGNTTIRVTAKDGEVNFTPPSDLVYLPRARCLTMEGFENWLSDNEIISDVSDYFENKNGAYEEFLPVCTRIRKNIRQDQIEGGMAGIFNPSITQRLNNLVERTDHTTKDEAILPIIGMKIVVEDQNKDDAN